MEKLLDYVREYPLKVVDYTCDVIVEQFEENPHFVRHYENETYCFDQMDVKIANPKLAMDFAHMVDHVAKEYFRSLGLHDYIPSYGFENVRIKKYLPDGKAKFDYHVDIQDAMSAKRFLIFILYLDDNEQGGTEFPTLGKTIKCEKGKLVCFPPTWQYPHAGLPPIGKSKYILMTSLHYL